MSTIDQRQAWLQPYRTILDEKRFSEVGGEWRMRVLDFSLAYDRTPVQVPPGSKRFGWILYIGSPNDPIVGAEDSPYLAQARCVVVRDSLVREIIIPEPTAQRCASCGKELEESPEPCANCGAGTCDECIVSKGGCGCMAGVDPRSVREVALTDEVLNQTDDRVAATAPSHSPTGGIPQNPSDIEAETARLEQAARTMNEAHEK